MPAATEPFTTAGTTVSIAANTTPAAYDATGFEALSYDEIAEITDAGEFGKQYALVTHNPIATRRTVKRKGSYNDGAMTLQLARVSSDDGQAAAVSALDSDTLSSFRVVLQDGTSLYFIGVVMSYTTNLGNVDQIVGSMLSVEISGDILEVNGGDSIIAGSNITDSLTVANTGNSVYNQLYTRMTNDLFIDGDNFGLSAIVNTVGGGYGSFEYDAGNGTWCVIAFNTLESEWQVYTTTTDPEALADDDTVLYALGTDVEPSFCATTEADGGGDLCPDSSDADVTYS